MLTSEQVYKGDSYHLMPVITPAYPQMCATFNVVKSTKAIIQRELERGGSIADQIQSHKLPWSQLFVKHSFFTKDHKYYLAINATSLTKEAHKLWAGFVESKVRILVGDVERHGSISIARPFNKGYDRIHRVKTDEENDAVQNGSLAYLAKEGDVADEEEEAAQPNGNGETTATGADPAQPGQAATGENGEKAGLLNGSSSKNGRRIYTTTYYVGLELAEGRFPYWRLNRAEALSSP